MKFRAGGCKPITDITGQKFGRLTPIWPAGRRSFKSGGSEIVWQCVCDCGNLVLVGKFVLGKATKSCGCLHRENVLTVNLKHGQSRRITGFTAEYRSYSHAKARCENPSDAKYPDYGGRGIQFRFDSFEEFFAHVGKKPSAIHSIDRINNDGNYEHGNVKWSTPLEQVHNRRKCGTARTPNAA